MVLGRAASVNICPIHSVSATPPRLSVAAGRDGMGNASYQGTPSHALSYAGVAYRTLAT
jgi:hypothetical protein